MKGRCLCGAVEYRLHGPITGINFCHCRQCRKASGSAFGTSAALARENLELVNGEEHVRRYQSSPGKQRVFCGNCGSPLYSVRDGADTVYVRLGTLEDDPGRKPDVHIHVASRAGWYEIHDDLPQLSAEEGLWF